MNELIQQLVSKAGLTEAQAAQAVSVTKDFLKTKLPPQMTGMVESFFAGGFDATAASAAAPSTPQSNDWTDKAKDMASDAGDKLGDFAGKAKDKAEDFAQDATKKMGDWANKAEDMAGDAVNKLKDIFGGDKKEAPKQ